MQVDRMTENNEVSKNREAIKAEIEAGKYKSLARVILNWTGRLVQRFTFAAKPPSFWYNSIVFALFTLLVAALLGVFLGNPITNVSPDIRTKLILGGLLGTFIGSSFLIAAAITHQKFLGTLDDSVLDVIVSEDDLSDLRRWLTDTFNMKGQLLISLVPALVILPLLNLLLTLLTGINLDITVYIVAIMAGFQAFVALPMLLVSFTMPHRLSRYQLKLFSVDPSSSEVIDSLSDAINSVLIIAGILLALLSIIFFLFTPTVTFSYVTIPIPWLILIIVFVSGQYALAKIINKAKWNTLNDIQTQIETLQAQTEILSEETLGHINKLLDYHNRIRTTHNSALDIRAGLSLLQSLLLPLISLLIANLLQVLDILSKFTAGE
jgi:hypothetical protein